MIRRLSLSLSLVIFSLFLSSCDESVTPPPATVKPSYNFENVNYGGQTVRILLLDSLMKVIDGAEAIGGSAVTSAQLNSIFDNSEALFAEISTNKKMSDKISQSVNPTMIEDLRAAFDTIALLSQTNAGSPAAVTTSLGHYLPELIEKGIMGSMMYAEAIRYLNDVVPLADNITIKPGEGTKMQHNWDEAFGYFGASRRFMDMSIDERSKNPSVWDVDNNGKIDPTSERNWYFARYSAGLDKGFSVFTTAPTAYGDAIFKAFVDGRKAIGEKNTPAREAATTQILENWDKIIAASAIKYAIDIKNKIGVPGSYNGLWAELKMFAEMTQYNSTNKLGAANYEALSTLIGVTPSGITTEALDQIITMIKTAYSF